MVSGKVIIPKAVAEAIEHLRSTYGAYQDESFFIQKHADTIINAGSSWAEEAKALNGFDIATFSRAILNGYTVELTPEERVLSLFDAYSDCDDYDSGVRLGAIEVLDIYGIKVKGVNV